MALNTMMRARRAILADSGRVCLGLGRKTEHFEVTLARLIRKSGGHWLAGLSFAKRKECRSRARGVIEHLKSAYRAEAVQAQHTQDGPVAGVLGNLNFNVVLSLHRLLRSSEPPRLIDLGQCSGADHSGIEFLLLMANQCIELKLDPNGRIAELIQRQRDAAAALLAHRAAAPAGLKAPNGRRAWAPQVQPAGRSGRRLGGETRVRPNWRDERLLFRGSSRIETTTQSPFPRSRSMQETGGRQNGTVPASDTEGQRQPDRAQTGFQLRGD
ncbi:MAG: hypothetical protein MZU95_13945 [Desulfomicrobium escambiense]|nr:hypothetical protein [Desulfomicrobium escambiense]